jgi:alkylated DNA repair protein alkB family protein 4
MRRLQQQFNPYGNDEEGTHNPSESKLYSRNLAGTVSSTRLIVNSNVSVPGLFLIYDFISEEEERCLVQSIDDDLQTNWKPSSFNGHCLSKVYGVRTQFGLPGEQRLVRRQDESAGEYGIPESMMFILNRLQQLCATRRDLPPELRSFQPNDCNVNSYLHSSGHFLKPHFDDRALSGPLLLNLSMMGRCRMTFQFPDGTESVAVPLPRRCLQLVTGAARWSYMHCIKAEDLFDERRVSITWRQSGAKRTGIRPLPVSKPNGIASTLLKSGDAIEDCSVVDADSIN